TIQKRLKAKPDSETFHICIKVLHSSYLLTATNVGNGLLQHQYVASCSAEQESRQYSKCDDIHTEYGHGIEVRKTCRRSNGSSSTNPTTKVPLIKIVHGSVTCFLEIAYNWHNSAYAAETTVQLAIRQRCQSRRSTKTTPDPVTVK
ncbi:hypothetical protein V1477_002652, partial [Vespula maculifrons]